MNRIEIIGLFSALEKLCDLKQYDAVDEVVKKVLREAETKQEPKPKDTDNY